ncbi:MAG: crossover junction endodeoxyribonuclease RuvC [Planctomycetota bacterium]|nr:MAG: crossover junction endodeoxyribonuclease RuvC [Planctomycetota bacterium]
MGTKILGIDPALGTTGYGLVQQDADGKCTVVDAGIVRCRRDRALELRLLELHEGVVGLINELHPDAIAVEQLYTHYSRPTTAILMGHARGVILLAAARAGIPVSSYGATQVKKTLTGNGRAPKDQMQFAVKVQLGLARLPEPADVADALAVALTHCHVARLEGTVFES